MFIHNFLKDGSKYNEEAQQRGIIGSILSYFWKESDSDFFYNIGGHNFTLEDLKHGLLRANKKPSSSYSKIMKEGDERLNLIDPVDDPRILFLCLDNGQVPEAVVCFDNPQTLDIKLDNFLKAYFEEKVEVDSINEE